MTRRKWLWTALLALPLSVAGGVLYANSGAASFICPVTGEQLPCANCCPLNDQQPFTCPATGEELPCSECCPLNRGE
jgi:hypothetical protein